MSMRARFQIILGAVVYAMIAGVLFMMFIKQVRAAEPTAIIAPNGQITYVYPPAMPHGPTTVLPSIGAPSFAYPPSMPHAPVTVLPPVGSPIYIYPGMGAVSSGYVLPALGGFDAP